MDDNVHLFGIRNHGPGSARSVRRALEVLQPDLLLVEGPPDADAVLPLLGESGMIPPVALLIYAEANPSQAVYYPFAHFSPEYQAIDFALGWQMPVRFMDLPQRYVMALPPHEPETLSADPLGELARAAGYDDAECWWDWMMEQRQDSTDVFAAILEAMTALRQAMPLQNPNEALREAYSAFRVKPAIIKGQRAEPGSRAV